MLPTTSNKKLSPKGVFETVSIHALDLILYNFGIKRILFQNLSNTSSNALHMILVIQQW